MAELIGKAAETVAASDPSMTARADAATEMMILFQSLRMNSSRTVDTWESVSGESPSERQPSQLGWKLSQGIRLPRMTSAAVLNEVETVQNSGKMQTHAQVTSRP